MDIQEFRSRAHEMVDWMADYLEGIESYPVRSRVRPREVIEQLPEAPPERGEGFDEIFADFQRVILPGVTHWQHPSFFGYFPANSSPPSVLGEMLTATLASQCMIWQTSPAAAELEERVMEWMRGMLGLPETLTGVIQDTASTATLCAVLTARERATGFDVNERGLGGSDRFAAYCSSEAHSSIEKAVKIAGLGRRQLRKIDVDDAFAMNPDALEAAIEGDVAEGIRPLIVVAAVGTTGSTSVDPLRRIGEICESRGIWLHVDAAYSGIALLAPEHRWMIDGIERVDSFVVNPHKWMLTNFDCTAYFVKDAESLIRTFEIMPEYLRTQEREPVNNYRDWGVPLGRRFRALKLWFVIRSYGVAGLRSMIRRHVEMAQDLARRIDATQDFERLAPTPLNALCFRYCPVGGEGSLDDVNARLLERLNATGKLFMTHTKLKGEYALRMVIGQTHVEQRHVDAAWRLIQETARAMDA